MKAKVKETGEIIKVSPYTANYDEGIKYYREIGSENPLCKCTNVYKDSELDFDDIIDWEQRRYEIAKDVLCSIRVGERYEVIDSSKRERVIDSIKYADILIEELKNK